MNRIRTAIVSLLLATVFGVLGVLAAGDGVPQVGQPAPDFTLPSQDGSNISLKDFRGKWVVLYFYPKDMTPGCTIEAHNFQQDLPKYDPYNAVIVGVSVDTTDSHKEFCAKESLTFKLLADPDKKVVEEYGSLRTMGDMKLAARNTFLIDPQGNIAKEWIGVNPTHHSEEVLAALAQLTSKS
ncbi:MAG TPA: redoxin domain-containing protein [Terriglobia bacterium]